MSCRCPGRPAGSFASRLPQPLKDKIRAQGLRNSHLLSIAPTGTISLAFADNASNGIEPAFSWCYTRRKREPGQQLQGICGRRPCLAPVQAPAWPRCTADRSLRHRAGDERRGPCRDGGRGGALHRHVDQQDGQRARGLSVQGLPGPLHPGMARRAQGAWPPTGPTACWVRCSALPPAAEAGGVAPSAAGPVATTQPAPLAPVPVADGANQRLRLDRLPPRRAGQPALARPTRAARRQPGLELPDRPSARRLLALRGRDAGRRRPRWRPVWPQPAVRGVGQRRRAAARPWGAGQDPVHGHAHQRRGLAQAQARCAGHGGRGARLRDALSRPRATSACSPAWWRPPAPSYAGAASNWARCRTAAPRPCSTPCSAATSPAPAPTARWPGRWTWTTTPPVNPSPSP